MTDIANTDILVIVGYSFPFFNKGVDKSLFQAMVGKLKKIYIQDAIPDTVITKLQSFHTLRGIEKVPINQTDEFYLPAEL